MWKSYILAALWCKCEAGGYRKIGVTLNVTNVTFAVTRINPSSVRFTFSLT